MLNHIVRWHDHRKAMEARDGIRAVAPMALVARLSTSRHHRDHLSDFNHIKASSQLMPWMSSNEGDNWRWWLSRLYSGGTTASVRWINYGRGKLSKSGYAVPSCQIITVQTAKSLILPSRQLPFPSQMAGHFGQLTRDSGTT